MHSRMNWYRPFIVGAPSLDVSSLLFIKSICVVFPLVGWCAGAREVGVVDMAGAGSGGPWQLNKGTWWKSHHSCWVMQPQPSAMLLMLPSFMHMDIQGE